MRVFARSILRLAIVGPMSIFVSAAACGGSDSATTTGAATGATGSGGGGGHGTGGNLLTTATTGTGSATTGAGGAGTTGSNTGGAGTTGSNTGGANVGGAAGTGGSTANAGGASTVGSGGAGGSGGTNYTSGVGGAPTVEVACQGHIYECGDTLDNDSDGLIDSQDPDCLGPCDNTEGSYFGGIPGQAGPACTVDCYFDQDSGSGNDDCYWSHKCDLNEVDPDFYPEPANGDQCGYDTSASIPGTPLGCDGLYAKQSQLCHDVCGPLTPNGCDCFGCCELPAGSGAFVWLGSEGADGNSVCSLADVGDPTKCHPCVPVAACMNTCEKCELCLGKTTVPDECLEGGTGAGGSGSVTGAGGAGATGAGGASATGAGGGAAGSGGSGGGSTQCSAGIQPCGLPGQSPCDSLHYCISGCCQPVPQ